MRSIYWILGCAVFYSHLVVAAEQPTLSLADATQRALAASPHIKASGAALEASKGEHQQAGALPNPELGVEAENVAGGGPYSGFDSAEVTLGVSQQIELGGKRSSRVNIAQQNMTLADMDNTAARLTLIRDVTVAYADVAAAEAQVTLAEEQKKLAEGILRNVAKRVEAARDPLIERSKAQVAMSTSTIALDKAQRELTVARKRLNSLLGEQSSDYVLDNEAFFNITEPPTSEALEKALAKNPDIARWQAAIARSEATLELEQANAVPDPRINVGVREFRETNDRAFVVGLSIPIPVFNANQGNIAKANAEVNRTGFEASQAKVTLGAEATRTSEELHSAYSQAKTLRDSILPAAKKAFVLAQEGYDVGRFPYLEVLDAQRTLYGAREQYHAALKEYHTKRAELERLTATHLPASEIKEVSHAQ